MLLTLISKQKKIFFILILSPSFFYYTHAQQSDSIYLEEVKIISKRPSPERLNQIENVYIFSGKKNEVIRLSNIDANTATNNTRQVFSRIPGVTIWENDGSGIQIGISARGLSPNRSWEFNTRQNGYDISSDVFGYPEAYYNPPLEAVERIEVVRGAASLQFGPQFGGLLNYILKRETENKPFIFETQQTIGSYGMWSCYNAIGGNTKKWSYYLYHDNRKGNGWRENGAYDVRNTHGFLSYKISEKVKISGEYTNMDYTAQQSGGLTDIQFEENRQQSIRRRNWFGVIWNLASIQVDIKANDHLHFNFKAFGLIGERNSIGFTARPNIKDTINTTLKDYNYRQVDRDHYKNGGAEWRGLYTYSLLHQKQNLAFGARIYQAHTNRKQRGKGDTGFDFNTNIVTDNYPGDYNYTTTNAALFVEHILNITTNFSITPGIRLEYIKSSATGTITTTSPIDIIPQNLSRSIVLTGIGFEYKLKSTNLYGTIAQNYRPVLFSDLTPSATTDEIDQNLKDTNGFNTDLGYRGTVSNYLNFDISVFYIHYTNRIGSIRKFINNDSTQNTFLFRTNLGKSINTGIEAYIEFSPTKAFHPTSRWGHINLFASMAFIQATYDDFKIVLLSGTAPSIKIREENLKGNQIEYAPRYIHNFGITYYVNNFSISLQTRITSDVFSDATNTSSLSIDGVTGIVKGYSIFDLAATYTFLEKYNLKGGINNFTDAHYATRRAGGYPGPGVLPGEGRTMYISIGGRF